MKKILRNATAIALLASTSFTANAQLVDGDIITGDFTITELLGTQTSHTLSTYLDAGKTVFIDVSAVWCGPCWSFHTSHVLEELYVDHGPAGMNGVSASTTDDVMVFFLEGDDGTVDQINGIGSGTEGDWTIGAAGGNGSLVVPILYGSAASTAADDVVPISGYPTMYMICPDRTITTFHPASKTVAQMYADRCNTSNPPSSATNDARVLMNFTPTGAANYCGSPEVTVKIQNFGSTTLTSATVKAYVGTTEVGTTDWTGSLAAYEGAEVTIPVTGNSTDDFTISTVEITTADDNAANNVLTENIEMIKAPTTTNFIAMDVLTDGYGAEFAYLLQKGVQVNSIYDGFWDNWQGAAHVSSMLNYQNSEYGTLNSIPNNTQYNDPIEIPTDGCHTLTVLDQYGDGLSSGHCIVTSGGNTLLNLTGSNWGEVSVLFDVSAAAGVGIEEAEIVEDFKLFPNPATSSTNLRFNLNQSSEATINVVNALGQTVYTEVLGNISGDQLVELSTSQFESGFYMVSLVVGNDVITTRLSVIK